MKASIHINPFAKATKETLDSSIKKKVRKRKPSMKTK